MIYCLQLIQIPNHCGHFFIWPEIKLLFNLRLLLESMSRYRCSSGCQERQKQSKVWRSVRNWNARALFTCAFKSKSRQLSALLLSSVCQESLNRLWPPISCSAQSSLTRKDVGSISTFYGTFRNGDQLLKWRQKSTNKIPLCSKSPTFFLNWHRYQLYLKS